MTLPQTEKFPDDPDFMPPARRRRARRLLAPLNADERAAFIQDLAHRASPSFDFFLFSLFSGVVLSLGLLADMPVLLILGAILAPLMAPLVGVSLGTVTGSIKFFARSLVGLAIGSLLVFLTGWVAGYAARQLGPLDLALAHQHALLSWPQFLLLAAGAVLTAAMIVHPDHNAGAPSVALAYELYLPLAVAGLGLGSGEPFLWPDGLVVFAIHLAWGALLGALTLALVGFRPLTLFGYTLGGAVTLVGVILLIGMSGAGAALGGNLGLPTPIPSATATVTLTPTLTPTPVTPTLTPTATTTPTPTLTPTLTQTPTPTPVLAAVDAPDDSGAFVRLEPGGSILTTVSNGMLVKVYPETVEADGIVWVRVETLDGIQGWMVRRLAPTVTPTP